MPGEHESTIRHIVENGIGLIWIVFIAIWGGTASYLSRLKANKKAFSVLELVGEWTISGFSGMVTAYVCMHFQMTFFMTAAAAGIAGHMGGRAISIIESVVEERAKKYTDDT